MMPRHRGFRLAQDGLALCGRYERTGRAEYLASGLGMLREALGQITDPAEKAVVSGNMGTALWRHHELTGDRAALDQSIALRLAALTSRLLGPQDATHWTYGLRRGFRARYDLTGSRADLDAAIGLGDVLRGLRSAAGQPDIWVAWMSECADDLQERAQRQADSAGSDRRAAVAMLADSDAAVKLRREVIAAASAHYRDRPGLSSNLGAALLIRSAAADVCGRPDQATADLAEAVGLHRETARAAESTHPYICRMLGNLCRALMLQAERTGEMTLLDEAADAARRACRLAGDDVTASAAADLLLAILATLASSETSATGTARLTELIDLLEDPSTGKAGLRGQVQRRPSAVRTEFRQLAAEVLMQRYSQVGEIADLDRVIAHYRAVLSEAGPAGPADQQDTVSALSTALRYRYERTKQQADLTESTRLARAALAAAANAAVRADRAGLLAVCLMLAAEGDPGRMAEAIGALRQAVAEIQRATADSAASGSLRADALLSMRSDLALALVTRYEETRDLADLDEAIDLGRTVAAAPSQARDRDEHGGYLARLGIALQIRYRHTGSRTDLGEAIKYLGEGTGVLPSGDPLKHDYLSSLGLALQLRYGKTGQAADIDEAVRVADAAVTGKPAGERDRAGILSNAGLAHRLRSELTGDEEDLRLAIELGRASVAAVEPDEQRLPSCQMNLGTAYWERFKRHGAQADLRAATAAYRAAAELVGAPRQTRLAAAFGWCRVTTAARDWRAAADAYETAVDLLELVVWHGLPRPAREQQLGRLTWLAADAAASALEAGDEQRALSLLERGRSVLWTQRLRLRSSFDDVRDAAPDLHQRLVELAAALEADDPAPGRDARGTGDRRQQLAAAWDETLVRVRARPGLAGTLRSPAAAELVGYAARTPVVVVNVSAIRADALLLTSQGIAVLPLPGLTPDKVREQVTHLRRALAALTKPQYADPLEFLSGEQDLLDCLSWLRTKITGPVLDELDRTGAQPAAGPRLLWCPTGLLSLLPLHAAAHDRVISSYIPTLRALSEAQRQADAASDGPVLVAAVANPATPANPADPIGLAGAAALPPLSGVQDEARMVGARFPGRHTLRLGTEATRERIMTDLPGHPFAHFACHGTQDLLNPAQSALRLSDGPLSVLDLAALRLSGDLAFLSACSTAAAGTALPDEAIHLAAAVQAAGYRHVVATLWDAPDEITARLTDMVYRAIAPAGAIEGRLIPGALHAAVSELRSEFPDQPSLWACYAHFGP
jgi:hypothetical protein